MLRGQLATWCFGVDSTSWALGPSLWALQISPRICHMLIVQSKSFKINPHMVIPPYSQLPGASYAALVSCKERVKVRVVARRSVAVTKVKDKIYKIHHPRHTNDWWSIASWNKEDLICHNSQYSQYISRVYHMCIIFLPVNNFNVSMSSIYVNFTYNLLSTYVLSRHLCHLNSGATRDAHGTAPRPNHAAPGSHGPGDRKGRLWTTVDSSWGHHQGTAKSHLKMQNDTLMNNSSNSICMYEINMYIYIYIIW